MKKHLSVRRVAKRREIDKRSELNLSDFSSNFIIKICSRNVSLCCCWMSVRKMMLTKKKTKFTIWPHRWALCYVDENFSQTQRGKFLGNDALHRIIPRHIAKDANLIPHHRNKFINVGGERNLFHGRHFRRHILASLRAPLTKSRLRLNRVQIQSQGLRFCFFN